MVSILHPWSIFLVYVAEPTRPVFLYSDLPSSYRNVNILLLCGFLETWVSFLNWGIVLYYLFLHLAYMYSSGTFLKYLMQVTPYEITKNGYS